MTISKDEIEARISKLMEEAYLLQDYGIRREQIVFIVSRDVVEAMFSFQCVITCAINGMFDPIKHEFCFEINGYPAYTVKSPDVFGGIFSCAIKAPPYIIPPDEFGDVLIVDESGYIFSRVSSDRYAPNGMSVQVCGYAIEENTAENGMSVRVWDYAIEENAADDSFTAPLESDTKELDAFLDSLNGMVNK